MPSTVPAALRTIRVFEIFAREKRPLTNVEIATYLDVAVSSASDLVHTLVEAGYLMRTARRQIAPTNRLSEIMRAVDGAGLPIVQIQESCERLRDLTGESTLAGRIVDDVVHVLVAVHGHHPLRYAGDTRLRLALHVSALGKALLSLSDDDSARTALSRRPLAQLASGTLTDIEALVAQVATFRKQGWALVENEGEEDLAAIAVAGQHHGEPLALSVVGPVGRLRRHFEDHLGALVRVADEIFDMPLAIDPPSKD